MYFVLTEKRKKWKEIDGDGVVQLFYLLLHRAEI